MTHDTLPSVNLVPASVVLQRRRRRLMLRWGMAVAATVFLAGLPGLYIGVNAALSDPLMGAQIERVRDQLETNQGELPRLRERIAKLEEKRRVLDLVRNRVDWPVVFGRIVEAGGERIRLTGLSASGGGVDGTEPIVVRLDGVAATQTATRVFVVQLEGMEVFDRVELERTERREMDDSEYIVFRIRASIGDDGQTGEGER